MNGQIFSAEYRLQNFLLNLIRLRGGPDPTGGVPTPPSASGQIFSAEYRLQNLFLNLIRLRGGPDLTGGVPTPCANGQIF